MLAALVALSPAVGAQLEDAGTLAQASPTIQPPRQSAPAPSPRAKPPPVAPTAAKRSVVAERVMTRYRDGDYEGVVALGPGLLGDNPQDHELRLALANSMAWTGRYASALAQYRALASTPFANQAEVGAAYIDLWRQRPFYALPAFERVLAREPGSRDASEGVSRALDRLRPRTTVRLGTASDTADMRRTGGSIDHVWWDRTAETRFEVGAGADREQINPISLSRNYNEIGFSVFRPRTVLAPRVDVSGTTDPCRSGYATAQVEPVTDWLRIQAGRVNWGRLAFNARALDACLYAARIGVAGTPESALGRVVYSASFNRISDANQITEASVRLEPEILKLGYGFSVDVGAAARHAKRNDPRYWSPADGHGIVFVGLGYSRWTERGGFYLRLQPGTGVWGEAEGFNWGIGGGGRLELGRNWAIGLDAWAGSNPRPGQYRYRTVTLALEHAW